MYAVNIMYYISLGNEYVIHESTIMHKSINIARTEGHMNVPIVQLIIDRKCI